MGATLSRFCLITWLAAQYAVVLPICIAGCLIAVVIITLSVIALLTLIFVIRIPCKGLMDILGLNSQDAKDGQVYARFDFKPSGSLLLRLPPDIRQKIWQHVLGDPENVYVSLNNERPGMQPCGKPSPPSMVTLIGAIHDNLPSFAFQRTCRQMYAETDHLFYSTTVFSFTDQPAFTAFVKGLTIIQQSNISKIHIYVPSYFFKSRRNKISAGESMATDDVISIVSGIQKLERLQTLELWVDASNPAGDKYQAHGIYQLLKSIQVTHSVKVLLFDDLFSDTRWLSMK